MSIRTRAAGVLVACLLFAGSSNRAAGQISADSPSLGDCTIHCVTHNLDLKLSQLPGVYVAMHFVKPDGAGRAAIGTYLAAPLVLAGVQHVFVATEASDDFTKLAQGNTGMMTHFAVDQGGGIAKRFKVEGGGAVVVLDHERREMWRLADAAGAPMNAAAFAAKMKGVWSVAAIKDYNLPKGSTLAVQGHDVVAYFVEGKARKGEEKFGAEYRGVTYRFATAENRGKFAAAPEKYLPTYGGWCASAIGAKGEKVEIDPTNFKVKDGRLFLFYKSIFADALKDWNKHEKEWEPAADVNWKKISGEGTTAK